MEYDHRLSGSPATPPPLKTKHHHLGLPSCFRPSTSGDALASAGSYGPRTHEMPEFRSKFLGFVSSGSHSGGGHGRAKHHHRRHRSADFKYDAVSYSRNFDEGPQRNTSAYEEASLHCWISRLPESSPRGEGDGRLKEGPPAHGKKDTDPKL